MRSLVVILFAVACTYANNPPPQYRQQQQQQGYYQPPPPPPGDPNANGPQPPLPGQGPVGQGAPVPPPPPPPPPQEDLPIDPSKPMPTGSLGRDAKLTAIDKAVHVMVDARADIFSAGMIRPDSGRGGVAPSIITLVPGGGFITVADVKGRTGCNADTPAAPPDGGACAGGNTDLQTAGNASGVIDHKHTQFLVGVFLGAKPGKPPKVLDFTDGESFPALAPLLGQTFFIGDGLTGDHTGDAQKFKIPTGAVRLYLGYADGFDFHGAPGWYADNTGGVSLNVAQHQ
jgi:hypothetical protein